MLHIFIVSAIEIPQLNYRHWSGVAWIPISDIDGLVQDVTPMRLSLCVCLCLSLCLCLCLCLSVCLSVRLLFPGWSRGLQRSSRYAYDMHVGLYFACSMRLICKSCHENKKWMLSSFISTLFCTPHMNYMSFYMSMHKVIPGNTSNCLSNRQTDRPMVFPWWPCGLQRPCMWAYFMYVGCTW